MSDDGKESSLIYTNRKDTHKASKKHLERKPDNFFRRQSQHFKNMPNENTLARILITESTPTRTFWLTLERVAQQCFHAIHHVLLLLSLLISLPSLPDHANELIERSG